MIQKIQEHYVFFKRLCSCISVGCAAGAECGTGAHEVGGAAEAARGGGCECDDVAASDAGGEGSAGGTTDTAGRPSHHSDLVTQISHGLTTAFRCKYRFS